MNRELVLTVRPDDCRVEHFRAGGPGGQKVNKTSSAVRVTHEPSGAVGESREERSQHENLKRAFRRMAESPQFRAWAHAVASGAKTPKEIEADVAAELADPNITVTEVWRGKRTGWVRVSPHDLEG